MKAKSLRGQLTRAALGTILLAMGISAGALLAYESMIYREAWVGGLTSQAELIAKSTAAALVFDDDKAAKDNLASLRAQARIRAAALYDAKGSLIATYSSKETEQIPAKGTDLRAGAHFSGQVLELTHAVQQDGERVGTLYLRAEHDVWQRLTSYALILGAIVAASTGLAFLVFGRLQRRITTPLERMTDVARDVMSTRDWSLRAPATEYQDISVLVEAFNGMLQECGASEKRKDAFLATLAHELRNPLAPMTGAVALMRMSNATPAAKEKALAILERQLRQMSRLIDDLLDTSRIATGKLSLNKEAVNLAPLLSTAVEHARPFAVQKGIELVFDLPGDAVRVSGDELRLAQVFANLLNNACRYTPPGGMIQVTLSVAGSDAQVLFRDTGIGIEPEMQEQIFEMFEQTDKSLERGNSGLGVGLTLARQIVRLHGGDVLAASAGSGRGACFTVRLPALAALEPRPIAPARAIAANPNALRILLADDNRDIRESFSLLLRTLGHLVEVVEDGEAAVLAASKHVPDIALLDIGMPKMNGFEVARRLRANEATRAVRLVAITGWGQASDRQASKEAGFDRHLVKPVDPAELIDVISEVLKSA